MFNFNLIIRLDRRATRESSGNFPLMKTVLSEDEQSGRRKCKLLASEHFYSE